MKTDHQSKSTFTALIQVLKQATIIKAVITTSTLVLLSAFIYMQSKSGALEISIKDKSTKTPIAYANAILSQKNTQIATLQSDINGKLTFKNLKSGTYDLTVSCIGYTPKSEYSIVFDSNKVKKINLELNGAKVLSEIAVNKPIRHEKNRLSKESKKMDDLQYESTSPIAEAMYAPSSMREVDKSINTNMVMPSDYPIENNESYAKVKENTFITSKQEALSTFSIDVDKASYSNVRRFINAGQLPPKEAVRTEELINYFPYQYKENNTQHPVSIQTELTEAPWQSQHYIAKIAMNAKKLDASKAPDNNLVFLIDVSGSMSDANKLPLVQSSLNMMLDELRLNDKIAIVVYAGAAGLVLPPTTIKDKQKIKDALNNLSAGGSTAGGAGIELAYKTAKDNFIKEGNNRVILCTDGDFNVGFSADKSLESLIEEKRKDGVYLTVLGYGMGNYKDSKMEILADKGNGNYAYIDNIQEAKKTLVNEMLGTLYTVAKDVKIQIEFNPALVQAYRLIGYENRMLAKEDFNNDLKDAGEVGAGHQVTAIYEIIPVGVQSNYVGSVDKLKYTNENKKIEANAYSTNSNELLNVKCRYKLPESNSSTKFEAPILVSSKTSLGNASEDTKFATALAAWSMLLRNSDYKGNLNYKTVIEMAKSAKTFDPEGYRAECIRLMESSQYLKGNTSPVAYGEE
jgi:Ca-activated chloride channel homolog